MNSLRLAITPLLVWWTPLLAVSQDTCTLPVINSSSGEGIYCRGDQVTLSIDGSLGDATQWEWFLGTCGQNIIPGETGNTISIVVTSSISYFVRGVGGCVPAGGNCYEISITLDDQPPKPTCPEDIMVMTSNGATSVPVDYPIPGAVDNCPGGVKIELIEGIKSGGSFEVGVTSVTYQFTDARSNSTTCSFDVTVKESSDPNIPTGPMITCPGDLSAEAEPGKCGATVVYQPPQAIDGTKVELTKGLGSGAFFPIGTTTETYKATDGSGNTMSCSFKVTVKDNPTNNQPPTIVLSKNSLKIWPPNHKMFPINIGNFVSNITGNCAINADQVVITKVTSDEVVNSTGDGNTGVDIVISDDCRSVDLRAERKGNGNGRVYTVHLAVVDGNGNTDGAKILAYVPHDNGNGNAIDDGPAYTVQGCQPQAPPPTEAPPVFYTYVDNEAETLLTTSINPYPNPFTSALSVRYTATADDVVSLDLYDLNGIKYQKLFRGTLNAEQTYNWSFDLPEIDRKIYLLIIKGRNTYVTRKVIKH